MSAEQDAGKNGKKLFSIIGFSALVFSDRGYLAMSWLTHDPSGTDSAVNLNGTASSAVTTTTESPRYRELLKASNDLGAQEAARTDSSFIASLPVGLEVTEPLRIRCQKQNRWTCHLRRQQHHAMRKTRPEKSRQTKSDRLNCKNCLSGSVTHRLAAMHRCWQLPWQVLRRHRQRLAQETWQRQKRKQRVHRSSSTHLRVRPVIWRLPWIQITPTQRLLRLFLPGRWLAQDFTVRQ